MKEKDLNSTQLAILLEVLNLTANGNRDELKTLLLEAQSVSLLGCGLLGLIYRYGRASLADLNDRVSINFPIDASDESALLMAKIATVIKRNKGDLF